MSYQVYVLRRAQKALSKIRKHDYERIRDAIRALAENPRPHGCRKLKGRDGWRLRVGSYRVIYEIEANENRVTVLDVGHRRDVYG